MNNLDYSSAFIVGDVFASTKSQAGNLEASDKTIGKFGNEYPN